MSCKNVCKIESYIERGLGVFFFFGMGGGIKVEEWVKFILSNFCIGFKKKEVFYEMKWNEEIFLSGKENWSIKLVCKKGVGLKNGLYVYFFF